MPQNPSWKWMPARPGAAELAHDAAASKAAARPCLPVIERLGDRVMLSADTEIIIDPEPNKVGIDQVLIGMIKGELQEATTELSLLKTVAEVDSKLVSRLGSSLVKIDDILYKATEVLIKGESKDGTHKDPIAKLQEEFSKIDALLGGLPELENVKVILDDMESKAVLLLDTLLKIEPVNELSNKERQLFSKITDTFGDLDAGLIKLQENVLARAAATGKHIMKGELRYVEIKVQDILASSQQVTDVDLKQELLGALQGYEELVTDLLVPPGDDDDGDGDDGGGGGGDVITIV